MAHCDVDEHEAVPDAMACAKLGRDGLLLSLHGAVEVYREGRSITLDLHGLQGSAVGHGDEAEGDDAVLSAHLLDSGTYVGAKEVGVTVRVPHPRLVRRRFAGEDELHRVLALRGDLLHQLEELGRALAARPQGQRLERILEMVVCIPKASDIRVDLLQVHVAQSLARVLGPRCRLHGHGFNFRVLERGAEKQAGETVDEAEGRGGLTVVHKELDETVKGDSNRCAQHHGAVREAAHLEWHLLDLRVVRHARASDHRVVMNPHPVLPRERRRAEDRGVEGACAVRDGREGDERARKIHGDLRCRT
eukprot:CAMPEP_0185190856 /NCGR_PEP_ID=MMETSP1140-20130426/13259_1 /TAXON_ID=298111 /ORGANISM="Pavlova sp., Strain CCMP459" /LENGTH=304 /DNA_ID=CAMNT_0027757531 /DNA_START=314 /DNA_END=1224 /DNA_ORIENTATION=+